DVLGQWRTRERDTGRPVDPSGTLAGSARDVRGPEDLRAALVADPEQFVQALTEKLMTFALGRGVRYYDMPTIRAIVDDAAASGWRFETIVRGIIGSPAFRMRTVPERGDAGATVAMTQGHPGTPPHRE